MLHVITFSGNMVMDGVVHLSLLSLLIPVVSWVLSSSSSAVCRTQRDILGFTLHSFLHESLPSALLPYQWKVPLFLATCSRLPSWLWLFWHVVWSPKWKCGGNTQTFASPRLMWVPRQLTVHVGIIFGVAASCELHKGSQAGTSNVDVFKLVFTAKTFQGSAFPIDGAWITTNFHFTKGWCYKWVVQYVRRAFTVSFAALPSKWPFVVIPFKAQGFNVLIFIFRVCKRTKYDQYYVANKCFILKYL